VADAGRWERVKDLFQAALERPTEKRAAFLEEACADTELRSEVLSLLEAHDHADGFMEVQPPPPVTAVGRRLGPYDLLSRIGRGGMGDVYKARDTRLGREVAVKVLPADLAGNPDRRQRFEHEARAASALNHPNIVAVYDVGFDDLGAFIVTELLEGQSLAERMGEGALGTRKALECGVQVARGLEAAHSRGIVHRDLKPANLFLTTQGQIKILDFGIAKLTSPFVDMGGAPGGGAPETKPGLVLGTVGYMSPEQVRGQRVDPRSDQFSLGCVLYEMLGGKPPFTRPSTAQTLAAVLEAEPPPLAEIAVRLPRPVAWVVERCLAKDPHDRYAATGDLARDLELALARLQEMSQPISAARTRRRWPTMAALVVGAAAIAGLAAAAGYFARREPSGVPRIRYLTYSGNDSSPAASPDGATIAFSSLRDGRRRIWLKQLASGSEAPLTSGQDDFPRFSPDGAQLLFARSEGAHMSLYRVPTVGGEPRRLMGDALYGDFSPDGARIVFVRQLADGAGITSVVATAQADGTAARELLRFDASALPGGAFIEPRWSPDGRRIAVTQSTLQLGEPTVIGIVDAQTGAIERVPPPGGAGVWRGSLAWVAADTIACAQPESVVGQQTGTSSSVALLELASRRARTLLFVPVNVTGLDVLGPGRLVLESRFHRQSLREVALDGTAGGERWLTRGNGVDRQPAYHRDGEWIAFSSNRTGNLDIWSVSTRSGAVRRLIDHPAHDSDPGFMPDGRLLWSSNRSGRFEVWIAEPDGSGARQVSQDGVDAENPVATPDGEWIVYASANPSTRGLMKVRPNGGDTTVVLAGNLIEPEVSPDGKHVAFVADAGTQRPSLRVVALADGAPVLDVALPPWNEGGGIDQGRCRWLPDGRGLVYVVRDRDGYAIYSRLLPAFDAAGVSRRVASLSPDLDAESLGVSPDGARLTVSFREQRFDLMLAEGMPGVDRPRRSP